MTHGQFMLTLKTLLIHLLSTILIINKTNDKFTWNVIKNGLNGQSYWTRQWRDPEPKSIYDVVIIGGGLHGLATAYYLAKNHNIKNVAVLEKGWIGGGNAGRNTTIVRSNYMMPGNHEFYEHSLSYGKT